MRIFRESKPYYGYRGPNIIVVHLSLEEAAFLARDKISTDNDGFYRELVMGLEEMLDEMGYDD